MKLKLFLFSLLMGTLAQAQLLRPAFPDIDSLINSIRKQESSFQKLEKYRDSTGTRCAFVQNGQLIFTRAEVNEQNINKKVEWYFDKGQIIYCQQTWRQLPGRELLNDEKLYLKDGKLLEWISTEGKPMEHTSKAFKETEFYLVDYSKKLIKEALGN